MFNIEDYLVTGAPTKIVLINSDASDSVIWNSGGYASLGASATFIGTILAKDYIMEGFLAVKEWGADCESASIFPDGQTCATHY